MTNRRTFYLLDVERIDEGTLSALPDGVEVRVHTDRETPPAIAETSERVVEFVTNVKLSIMGVEIDLPDTVADGLIAAAQDWLAKEER